MTDKLRAAAEMALEALEDVQDMMTTSDWFNDRVQALRQALAEPDMGTDRGAWADVPDATKWVDELRGDEDLEEPPNSTTDVVEPEKPCGWVNEHGTFTKQLPYDVVYSWRPVYASPKRKWVGLTDEELNDLARWADEHGGTFHTAYGKAIEAALKNKNGF